MGNNFRILHVTICIVIYPIGSLAATTGVPTQEPSGEAHNLELAQIVESWRSRQVAAETIDIAWRSEKFVAHPGVLGRSGLDAPAESAMIVENIRLVLDETLRVRLDQSTETWSEREKQLVPNQKHFVFDEHKHTVLFSPGGNAEFSRAYIGRGSTEGFEDIKIKSTLPVRLVYRVFDPVIGVLDPEGLQIHGEKAVHEGAQLLVVEALDPPKRVVWVDPRKDMLPVRYLDFDSRTNTLKWQLDLNYEDDPEQKWVLSSWSLSWLSPKGNPIQSETATVTECRINEPLNDSVFDIEIPVGTYVQDGFTNEKYILREVDEKRPVLPGELRRDNFQQLLTSEPGEAFGKPREIRWLLVLNIAIVLVLIAAVLWFRWLRKPAT